MITNDTREAITIDPAEDGGYVVLTTAIQGYRIQIKFAGSLTQCLEYIQRHFAIATVERERSYR